MISLKNLTEKLLQKRLELKHIQDQPNTYYLLNTLTSKATPHDGTLYIGYCSSVTKEFLENEKIGLILVNDNHIELNEQIKCEVAFYAGDSSILEIFHDIQAIFQERSKIVSDMSLLIDGLIQGKNTTELIDLASMLLENSIMLTNSSYKVIAMSSEGEVHDPVWEDAKKYGCCSADSITFFKHDAASNQLFNSSQSFLYNSGLGSKMPRILRKISFDHTTLGYICVFESKTKLENRHIELTDKLADFLAIEMKGHLSGGEFTNVIYENLLYDLLDDKVIPEISLNQRILAAKWEVKPLFCVLRIEVRKEGNSRYYTDYVRKLIEETIGFAKTVIYHDDIVLLLNFSEMPDYENCLKKVMNIVIDNDMQAGISRIFNHLSKLRDYYAQACSALELGPMFKPGNPLFKYEEFSIFHLFSLVNRNELTSLCHPDFYKLVKYDQENSTDFCHTLYQYIVCGSNISEAAKRLFIHRNTLFYRLKKINELIDLDLSNGEDIFQFYLTKKIETWLTMKP